MTLSVAAIAFATCAAGCVLIAALTRVSRAKGRIRLAGALLIGTAFPVAALSQAITVGKVLPGVIGVLGGLFLVWVGLRKYRRDPEGRTPLAQIL